MIKIASLRETLLAANPYLAAAPDKLHVLIESGHVATTMASGASFHCAYTAAILVMDYAGHPDSLFVPLIGWLRRHQPDLLLNHDKQKNAITFEAELISATTADIAIKVPLTERVIVRTTNGQLTADHKAEPELDPGADIPWELYLKNVHVPWPPKSVADIPVIL